MNDLSVNKPRGTDCQSVLPSGTDFKSVLPVSVESLVGQIADEFTERLNRGEQPDIEEYAQRHPDIADLLRQALPALQALEPNTVPRLSQPIHASDEPNIPGPLGDFRILREVGRGGMGIVYEAQQISLGRRVALKVLPFAATMDPKQLQRFKNEAQAAANLHHQNIVPVHYVGCERGVHFYAMQFIEGKSLADVISELRRVARPESSKGVLDPKPTPFEDSGRATPAASYATTAYAPLPYGRGSEGTNTIAGISTAHSTKDPVYFRTVAQLGIQAAEALDYAHQMGVIHRDVKPANLMIDHSPLTTHDSPRLWVTDFGLAQVQSDTRLTMTGDLVGTLRYMSPEQALAKRIVVDHRTDVYSLGATLYELLTLEPAYRGNDRQELLRQIAFEEPRPPRRCNKAIPVELETIILKALEKNPADRYATAKELADDLRRFLENRPIQARRPTLAQRAGKWLRRHQTLVGAACLVLLLAVAVLALSTALIWTEKNQKQQALDRAQSEYERAEEQRVKADAAHHLAEQQRQEAIDNLKDAHAAVNQLLSSTGNGGITPQKAVGPRTRQLLQDVLRFYKKFLERDHDDPELRLAAVRAQFNIGAIEFRLGEPRAEESMKSAISSANNLRAEELASPKCQLVLAMAWSNLGVLQLQDHRPREAKASFQEARKVAAALVASDPQSASYRKRLAAIQGNLGELHAAAGGQDEEAERAYDEATHSLEMLITPSGQDVESSRMLAYVQGLRGRLWSRQGRRENAEKLLSQAVAMQTVVVRKSINPEDRAWLAELHLSLGQEQARGGQLNPARDNFIKVVELRSQLARDFRSETKYPAAYAESLYKMGLIWMTVGQEIIALAMLTDARTQYQAIVDLFPKEREKHLQGLADCCYHLGLLLATSYHPKVRNPAAAVEPARKAVELVKDRGDYLAALGAAYYRTGKYEEALRALGQSTKLSPPDWRYELFFLAMTHWRLDHKEEASEWYLKAVNWMEKNQPKNAMLQRMNAEAAALLGVESIPAPQEAK
jgi:serine/threonine protein kinase